MKLATLILVTLATSAAAGPSKTTRFPVRVKGKWGFIDKAGKVKIPAKYDQHTEFSSTDATAGVTLNGKSGRIDADGKTLIPFEYDQLYFESEGLSMARKGTECGYLDSKGAWAFKLERCDGVVLGTFSEGVVKIVEGKKTRYVDKTGNKVFEVDGIGDDMQEGYAAVRRGRDTMLVDKAGKQMPLPVGATIAHGFSKGTPYLNYMVKGPAWGVLGADLKIAVDAAYWQIGAFGDGLFAVETKAHEHGYVDAKGTVVIAPAYESAGAFSEGLAWVKRDGKLQAIDKAGKVVIAKVPFSSAQEMSGGLALVREGSLVGLVDKKGKVVMKATAAQHLNWSWSGDLIGFVNDKTKKIFYVNRTGKTVWKE